MVSTTFTTPAASPRAGSALGLSTAQRLEREWRLLNDDPRVGRLVSAWFAGLPGAAVLCPQDVVDLVVRAYLDGDYVRQDRMLTELLQHAAGDGPDRDVAWRVVVQVLLPKVKRATVSQQREGWSWDETFSVVVTALFEIVGTYPVSRRPRRVYNNLFLDTLHAARLHLRRGGSHDERQSSADGWTLAGIEIDDPSRVVFPSQPTAADPDDQAALVDLLARAAALHLTSRDDAVYAAERTADPRTELLETVLSAVRLGALSPGQAQLITGHYRSGPLGRDTTPRAMGADGARIRQQRSRAVRALKAADPIALLAA